MKHKTSKTLLWGCAFTFLFFLILTSKSWAEVVIADNENFVFKAMPYLRLDSVTINNNIDLDNKKKDDSTSYLGLDYSLGLDLNLKPSGSEIYFKFERNGPYDYDAPLFVHNTLQTSTASVEKYRNNELFPQLEEFWADVPLLGLPLKAKAGLFAYDVGHGLGLSGSYENYGISLHQEYEHLAWRLHYCYPDIANKGHGGPHINQEKEQGINYEHSKANFLALDLSRSFGKSTLQPYVGVLSDNTGDKRSNNFTTPTHKDTLGTFGLAYDLELEKFSLGLEAARNFGKAKSSDDTYKDVEHRGCLFFAKASYALNRFKPHSQFIFASGNKTDMDAVTNGDTTVTSGRNNAFSAYSPLNTNLGDAIYPSFENVPLVAMGGGNGLNYGISRPTTFGDPRLLENLILPSLGFSYEFNEKLSCTFDWWYLRVPQKGVGIFDSVARKLSADLGQEADVSFEYTVNKNVTLNLLSGYFFPGHYYREVRDDTSGSLLTPFVRGDGEADGAYQIELSVTVEL